MEMAFGGRSKVRARHARPIATENPAVMTGAADYVGYARHRMRAHRQVAMPRQGLAVQLLSAPRQMRAHRGVIPRQEFAIQLLAVPVVRSVMVQASVLCQSTAVGLTMATVQAGLAGERELRHEPVQVQRRRITG